MGNESTPTEPIESEEPIGLLFDGTRCIGCLECVRACQAEHDQPVHIEDDLSATTFTTVKQHSGQYMRRMCMHCLEPTCVSVCPVAALRKNKDGQVTYNADACIGCRYCIFACPFNVPRYQWGERLPAVSKCDFCIKRTSQGGQTACAWVCPMEATQSGSRSKLLAIARERIRQNPDRYVNHIYGEHEAGGTSVLLLSGVPFNQTGYTKNIYTEPLPELTWRVLSKLPYVVTNAGILLGGMAWIVRRRMFFEKHPELIEDLESPRKEEGQE